MSQETIIDEGLNKPNHDENSKNRKSLSKNIGPYVLGKTLGEGTFGKVKLGTHILTQEKVAVKILEKSKIIENSDKVRVEREIKILKKLIHKNIIQLYQVIQTRTNLYIIMEYASGGELFDYIVSKRCLVEIEACKYFQQIISGIEYFHKLQIVHRDLKPENLLLDANRNLKIVDFGLSNIYEKNELLNTPCGSPCYAAPEMIAGKKYSGIMVDIWSAGIILYAMLCGYLPFDEENNDLLYKKIQIGDFKIPKNLSDKAKDFLRKILEVDPIKRYNIAQIKEHPWFHLNEYSYNEGIFINKHIIPVDENILISLKEYNFDINSARRNLLDNRHNHITSAYYLLLKKHLRKGNNSISDLESELFKEYINNPRNLLKNKDLYNDVKQNEKINELSNLINPRTNNKPKTLDLNKVTKMINSANEHQKNNVNTPTTNDSKKLESTNKEKQLTPTKDEENKATVKKSPSIKNFSLEKKEESYSEKVDLPVNKQSNQITLNNKRDRNPKLFLNTSMSFDHNNQLDERRNFSIDNKMCKSITQEKSPGRKKSTLKTLLDNKKILNKKFSVLNQKKVLKSNIIKRQNLNKSAEECLSTNVNYNQTLKEKPESNSNYMNEILIKKKKKKTLDIKKYMFGCDLNKKNNSRNDKQTNPYNNCYFNISTNMGSISIKETNKNSRNQYTNKTFVKNKKNSFDMTNINNNTEFHDFTHLTNMSTYIRENVKTPGKFHNFSPLKKSIKPNLHSKLTKNTPKNYKDMLVSSINKTQIYNNTNSLSLISEKDVCTEGKIRYHHGVFDISCSTLKSPFVLREDLIRVFTFLKINSNVNESKNNFSFRCNYYTLSFDLEIKKLEMFQNLYLMHFSKIEGNNETFTEICSKVLIQLKL